jgi:hypothetical protein
MRFEVPRNLSILRDPCNILHIVAAEYRMTRLQNAFVESFNGRMRDEFLNETLFFGLDDAKRRLVTWVADYNGERPHSSLRYQTPAAYAAHLTSPQRAIGCARTSPGAGQGSARTGGERRRSLHSPDQNVHRRLNTINSNILIAQANAWTVSFPRPALVCGRIARGIVPDT